MIFEHNDISYGFIDFFGILGHAQTMFCYSSIRLKQMRRSVGQTRKKDIRCPHKYSRDESV